MAQHKWHKEIKAWADGAEIQCRRYCIDEEWNDTKPIWDDLYEYRIKPQPKEPQYLKVYGWLENGNIGFYQRGDSPYIGKIKLENEDE